MATTRRTTPRASKDKATRISRRSRRKLRRTLTEAQRGFAYDTLRLPSKALGELAGILVDFAEDLHDGTGIWAAYERYNAEFFGTALPLTSESKTAPTSSRPFPSLPLGLVPGVHRRI